MQKRNHNRKQHRLAGLHLQALGHRLVHRKLPGTFKRWHAKSKTRGRNLRGVRLSGRQWRRTPAVCKIHLRRTGKSGQKLQASLPTNRGRACTARKRGLPMQLRILLEARKMLSLDGASNETGRTGGAPAICQRSRRGETKAGTIKGKQAAKAP